MQAESPIRSEIRSGRRRVNVAGTTVGDGCPVFVIAEIGCNFEDSFERAKEMVRGAARAGASAVKFQTFIPESLATRSAPKFWDIQGCPGDTQLEEFQAMTRLSAEQYRELMQIAAGSGVMFFSTPSDEESADMLAELDVPAYKISSMDITHIPLLTHVARKNRPMFLSTGGSTIAEIREAVDAIEAEGNSALILLHCISCYPAAAEDVNLKMIASISARFPAYPIGYSDHTRMDVSRQVICGAVALGATVVEKHFSFDRTRAGYDHEISADYRDLAAIVDDVRRLETALGSGEKRPAESERRARLYARRSLVAAAPVPAGATLSRGEIAIKRPAGGIEPRFLDSVIGRRATREIGEDEVITWDMIEA